MKKIISKILLLSLVSLFLTSCGEEVLAPGTVSESFTGGGIDSFELNTCAAMHFEKPPVDLLFVVDNSGSSLLQSFNNIKQQIRNTVNTISTDFDYHIYIAPLLPLPGDNISAYQLVVSNPNSLVYPTGHPQAGQSTLSQVNVVNPENIELFAQATGNNDEHGISRATALINANRTNGIFRKNANTIIVNISNGDDNEAITTIQGNQFFDASKFNLLKNDLLKFTKKYSDTNSVSNPLEADSLRYISLVAHSSCNGWKTGTIYRRLSQDIYNYMGYTDDNSLKDSRDLCSGNYSNLFSAINNSIRAVIIGHQYDHWKISSAQASSIQEDDITVTKISATGAISNIPSGTVNGFEYLGYKVNQNTRFAPTPGEPATGLIIKLNGNAQIEYPECIIAKTRTPTEYFGFLALPREPQSGSIKVIIRGEEVAQDSINGWGYIGWNEVKNIKVPGPTGASVNPPLNRSGYFIQLFGNAIFTNGDSIEVFYKPAAL